MIKTNRLPILEARRNASDLTLRLAERRKQLGESLGAVAERAGVDKDSLRRWENGNREPHLPSAIAWAKALGMRIDVLEGGGS